MVPNSGAGGACWLGLAGLAGLARYPYPLPATPLDFFAGLAGLAAKETRNPSRNPGPIRSMFTPSTYPPIGDPKKDTGRLTA
jgi:hypothetical protein